MKQKSCFKCGLFKPITAFYRHPRMTDGHLGKCKECTKQDVSNRYYSANGRPKVLEYEKARFQSPERKAKLLKYQKDMRLRSPEKYKARTMLRNAIRDRRIIRMPCIICGDAKSQAHHHDYSKPLDVTWLCFRHHREIGHNQIVGVESAIDPPKIPQFVLDNRSH